MDQIENLKLSSQLSQARNELNNIRKSLHSARAQHRQDVERLEDLLKTTKSLQINNCKSKEESAPVEKENCEMCSRKLSDAEIFHMKPIGIAKSLHKQKNGTPRQGAVSSLSRAKLQIKKDVYNNPSHSLEGLSEYSHVWLIYIFHQNTSDASHAKVSPPRLDGSKLGVFSTRSPHRPNPIGLTLAKLDKIEGDSLLLSGVDLLDGTPVIDIKPYIPYYDSPLFTRTNISVNVSTETGRDDISSQIEPAPEDEIYAIESPQNNEIDPPNQNENLESALEEGVVNVECEKNCSLDHDTHRITPMYVNNEVISVHEESFTNLNLNENLNLTSQDIAIPQWLKSPPSSGLKVVFNPIAEHQIKCFSSDAQDACFRLEYLKCGRELRAAIRSVLSEDPRSTYRRHKCSDRLYFFMVDSAHITTCFFSDVVEVLRVCPPDKDDPAYKLI